ncbi:diguanylate cyclase [Hathewaya limosa]|uniref:Diguanylate cyclase (GGDEF)-like protein n=1 Tax=Hathewaya limosa TaxID=1536 RepID=A0ABU0JNN6_HATLI|nr:diguanylate cyclase [Hathewaya limosa]MDQ0478697.1 diguanylate cyclase (GGDEF)-like protein [Hathewaya limosa]
MVDINEQIINKRFKILKQIQEKHYYSSVLIEDILNNNKVQRLTIIKEKNITKQLKSFYKEKIFTLLMVETENITKIYHYNNIIEVNDKCLNTPDLFYICENYEEQNFDKLKTYSDNEVLYLFIELLQSVNYLHIKGIAHNGICFKNISLCIINKRPKLILRDIITSKLNKEEMDYKVEVELFDKCNEKRNNMFQKDIHALGILLYSLIIREFNVNILKQVIINCKPYKGYKDTNTYFFTKLRHICMKMIGVNRPIYNNVSEIIVDINNSLNLNFSKFRKEELEKLNSICKLVGREREIKYVKEFFQQFKKGKADKNICLIHGEKGIGKTKLLNGIKRKLIINGEIVYDNLEFKSACNNGKDAYLSFVIKQILKQCDLEIIKKYRKELEKLFYITDNCLDKEILLQEKEKFRIVNRIGAFINEAYKFKKVMIILDDFHKTNEFTRYAIKYISSSSDRIFFVLASTDDDKLHAQVLKSISCDKYFKVNYVKIRELSDTDIESIIYNKLFIVNGNIAKVKSINSIAKGNPLIAEEIIKELYIKKKIVISKNGDWEFNYKDSELVIPLDVKKIIISKINTLSNEEKDILSKISLFYKPISYSNLMYILNFNKPEFENIIERLKEKGIIHVIETNKDILFNFYNRFLKDIFYYSLSFKRREISHKVIVKALEKLFYKDDVSVLDELIFQLEQLKDRAKLTQYYMEKSLILINKKRNNEALVYLKKSVDLYKRDEVDGRKAEIYYNMGKIYIEKGEFSKAERCLKNAFNISRKTKDNNYNIMILTNLMKIYVVNENCSSMKSIISSLEEYMKSCKDTRRNVQFLYQKGLYYSFKNEYKTSLEVCNKALELSEDNFNDLKGEIYNLRGYTYMELSMVEEAIYSLKISINYSRLGRNYRALHKAYTNLGVIYGDFLQDYTKAIQCIRMAEYVVLNSSSIVSKIRTKSNLGSLYLLTHQYGHALKNIKDALNLIKDKQTYEYVYCNIICCRVSIRNGDYREAYNSFREISLYTTKEMSLGKSRNRVEEYLAIIEFNLLFGQFEQAIEFIDIFRQIVNEDKSILKLYSQVYEQCIGIINNKNTEKCIRNVCDILNKNIIVNNKIDIVIFICVLLINNKQYGVMKNFIRENKEILFYNKVPTLVNIKMNFLSSFLYDDLDEREYILKNVLMMCKKNNFKQLFYKVAIELANIYNEKNEYEKAVVCYFLAYKNVRKLLSDIPKKYMNSYVFANNLQESYDNFIRLTIKIEGKTNIRKNLYELLQMEGEQYKPELKDYKFIMAARDIYNFYPDLKIKNLNDIFEYIQDDDYENLNIINKFIAYITLATRSMIVCNNGSGFKVITSNSSDMTLDELSEELLNKCRSRKSIEFDIKKDLVRICMPIISPEKYKEKNLKYDRRKNSSNISSLLGYVFIEIDCILKSFLPKETRKWTKINNLLYIILDKINLKKGAFYDRLTGALTRKYLDMSLQDIVENSSIYNYKFSVLMIDFDHFKHINDFYGHQVGDKVLAQCGNIIKNSLRKDDILGRYGGEELLVVLPGVDKNSAYEVGEKLRKYIENSILVEEKGKITVSMGVASYPEHSINVCELIDKADKALYLAKERGRNCVVTWDDSFNNTVKCTNSLSRFISKSFFQDDNPIFNMLELLELVKKDIDIKFKINNILEKMIDLTKSDKGYLFIIKNKQIIEEYGLSATMPQTISEFVFNESIVIKVIENRKGTFLIDWDFIEQYNENTNIPSWNSLIVIPIIYAENVIGIIYLSVPISKKEFDCSDFNMIELLSSVITPIIMDAVQIV